MNLDTSINSSSSLFTDDELDMLKQLNNLEYDPTESSNETFVEFKDGQYGYYIGEQFDQVKNDEDDAKIRNIDWKLCPVCHEKLQDLGVATSECPKCGAEIVKASEDHEIKKSGGFSGVTQPNYLNCDSKAHIKRKLINELKQKNYDTKKHMVPTFIIETAIDKFLTISEKKIHRGSVQRGLKGMLIKYTLDENNMSKSTKVIGQIYGLTDKQLSAADALIRDYAAQGIIKISCLNADRTVSFISNYVGVFGIDSKYVNFILELIAEADRVGVHLSNNYKPSTKATGAFLLFLSSFPDLPIKRTDVIKESGLTSSTVNRYYNLLLLNISLLTSVYNRWGIKLPVENKVKVQKNTLAPPPPITLILEPLDNSGIIQ
jgi:hypothetical protein